MEEKDKFKLLRDEDGVIIIHDGEAERREGYTREGFEKHISKEERLKSSISLNENKGSRCIEEKEYSTMDDILWSEYDLEDMEHDVSLSTEELDIECQILLEEIKKMQERNK